MNPEVRAIKEREVERLDSLLIAAESWANSYKKDKETYKRTVRNEAKLRNQIKGVFRDVANDVDKYINWTAYYGELQRNQLKADVNVEVIVTENLYDDLDALFFQVVFSTISTGIAIGAQAGESIYKIPLGIQSSDAIIQSLTTDRLAFLIGKSVDKSGAVVDNPKAEYRISDKTRADIAKNIQSGIALGEDKQTMTKRLQTVIRNPRRAEIIAQTETVNAYGEGLLEFGKQSQATGKEWETVGAEDVCAEYAMMGIVPINYLYGGNTPTPAAHTGCRCNIRIVYANEFAG